MKVGTWQTRSPRGSVRRSAPIQQAPDVDQFSPRVLILCDWFPPASKAGGPSVSLSRIAASEHHAGIHCMTIVTRDRDLGDRRPFSFDEVERAQVFPRNLQVIRIRASIVGVARWLKKLVPDVDLLYCNSVFSPCFTLTVLMSQLLRMSARRTILLAPRGELAVSALEVSKLKKQLVGPALRFALRHLPIVWHASSSSEAKDIQRYLGTDPRAIVVRTNPGPAPMASPRSPTNDRLTIAFVARMVPIKNFIVLANAIQQLSMPVTVRIAGPIEDREYWKSCLDVVSKWSSSASLDLLGHLDGPSVTELLINADVLVLPTKGENFGHAIAEALSVGCPVMIPDTTLWTSVVHGSDGWIIDTVDPAPLAAALMQLSAEQAEDRKMRRARVADAYAQWWTRTQLNEESLFAEALTRLLVGTRTWPATGSQA